MKKLGFIFTSMDHPYHQRKAWAFHFKPLGKSLFVVGRATKYFLFIGKFSFVF